MNVQITYNNNGIFLEPINDSKVARSVLKNLAKWFDGLVFDSGIDCLIIKTQERKHKVKKNAKI